MVLEYDEKYDDDIKDLLVELQEYIQNIDIEGYNILQKNYRKLYLYIRTKSKYSKWWFNWRNDTCY